MLILRSLAGGTPKMEMMSLGAIVLALFVIGLGGGSSLDNL